MNTNAEEQTPADRREKGKLDSLRNNFKTKSETQSFNNNRLVIIAKAFKIEMKIKPKLIITKLKT